MLAGQLCQCTTADEFALEEAVLGKKYEFERRQAHSQQQEQYSLDEGGKLFVRQVLELQASSALVVVEDGDEEKTNGMMKG
jgi:hypothetical protein